MAGQFKVSNGQIIDPSGSVFIAHGINIYAGQMDAATVLATFPGINMVRLATTPGQSDMNQVSAFVQTMTANHVVVEIEDHTDDASNNNNVLTGSALAAEDSWFAGIAKTYAGNPYVWFGTYNEPGYGANTSDVANQELANYNAIRGAGNNNPIMLEMRGGFTNAGLPASTYAGMTNVIWDTHFYGWVSNYSTNPTTIANALSAQIADAQSIRSADGTVPVIIGEYGISSDGTTQDANAFQTLTAVQQSGDGNLAWAWNAGADALTSGSSTLTQFGKEVASYISTHAASGPSAGGTSGGTGGGSTGGGTSGGSTTGGTSGGSTTGSGSGSSGTASGGTSSGSPTPQPPAGTGNPDRLSLKISEDAWANGDSISDSAGDARFTVSIDGVQQGGTFTATASHDAGAEQSFAFIGNFGSGQHTVKVTFLNDAWGGDGGPDRNLYVDGVVYDGADTGQSAQLWSNGSKSFAVSGGTAASTSSEVANIAAGDAVATVTLSNAAINATSGSHTVFIKGASDKITMTGGTETLTASNGHNTITTGAGNDRITVSGSGNLIDAGAGQNTIIDNGSGNTIVLPVAGHGLDILKSTVLSNGDMLDLRPALGATQWTGSANTLSQFLRIQTSGTTATLAVSASPGGTATGIAQFQNASGLSLSALIAHAIT